MDRTIDQLLEQIREDLTHLEVLRGGRSGEAVAEPQPKGRATPPPLPDRPRRGTTVHGPKASVPSKAAPPAADEGPLDDEAAAAALAADPSTPERLTEAQFRALLGVKAPARDAEADLRERAARREFDVTLAAAAAGLAPAYEPGLSFVEVRRRERWRQVRVALGAGLVLGCAVATLLFVLPEVWPRRILPALEAGPTSAVVEAPAARPRPPIAIAAPSVAAPAAPSRVPTALAATPIPSAPTAIAVTPVTPAVTTPVPLPIGRWRARLAGLAERARADLAAAHAADAVVVAAPEPTPSTPSLAAAPQARRPPPAAVAARPTSPDLTTTVATVAADDAAEVGADDDYASYDEASLPPLPERPSRTELLRTVSPVRPAIAGCAVDLGVGPTSLRLKIGPLGTLNHVSSRPSNVDLDECAWRALAPLAFPQSGSGAELELPIATR